MTPVEQLIQRAETAARCVYISVDEKVADDLAHLIHALVKALTDLQRDLASYASAHDALMAERAALQAKIFRLQSQALVL
jgi:hypothetical protein